MAHTLRFKYICIYNNIIVNAAAYIILYYIILLYYCSDYFYTCDNFFLSFSPSITFRYAHMYNTGMPIAYCVSYMYIDVCELPTPRRRPTQKKKKKKKKAFPVYVTRAFQHARPPWTTTIRYILLISIILAAATATYKQ